MPLTGISILPVPDGTVIHPTAAARTKFCSSHNRPAPETVTQPALTCDRLEPLFSGHFLDTGPHLRRFFAGVPRKAVARYCQVEADGRFWCPVWRVRDGLEHSILGVTRRAFRQLDNAVKFSGSVADLADETRHAELPWISIPTRHYQPRRLAVSPLRCERSRCRRSPGPTRHDGVLRSDPAVVPHGFCQLAGRGPSRRPRSELGRLLTKHTSPRSTRRTLGCGARGDERLVGGAGRRGRDSGGRRGPTRSVEGVLSTWPPAGRVTAGPATADTGFPLKSSATRCGYIIASRSASETWRTCWPAGVSTSPMRPSGSGVGGSVLSMRADYGADVAGSETPGISTRCSSRSRVVCLPKTSSPHYVHWALLRISRRPASITGHADRLSRTVHRVGLRPAEPGGAPD